MNRRRTPNGETPFGCACDGVAHNPKSRAGRTLVNARWKRPDARTAASERMRAYWANLSPEQLAEKHAHLKRIAQQRRKSTSTASPP
jgi:hypothetical protein